MLPYLAEQNQNLSMSIFRLKIQIQSRAFLLIHEPQPNSSEEKKNTGTPESFFKLSFGNSPDTQSFTLRCIVIVAHIIIIF